MLRAVVSKSTVAVAACFMSWAAVAQTAPQTAVPTPEPAPVAAPATSPATPAAAVVPTAAAPAAAAKAAGPGKREECTRLPLSDIAFGREATIAQARMRLGEYADKVAKTRGWTAYAKSAEVASCEVYIDFGPLVGTEYKCLLAATFCRK